MLVKIFDISPRLTKGLFVFTFKVPASGPEITNIVTSARNLTVSWGLLNTSDSNGKITQYEVCYQRGLAVSNCTRSKIVTGVNNTMTTVFGLTPVNTYAVAVRAYTSIGAGKLGSQKTVNTSESGEFKEFLNSR